MSGSAESVLGESFVERIRDWLYHRAELSRQEEEGDYPRPDEWHWSDDEAADIVREVAALFEIYIDDLDN